MNITIVEPARTTGLTTLARLKGELGISLTDTAQDQILTDLLEDVSAAIVNFCHREFARASVTERQVGEGRTTQVLNRTPIVSLLAARFDGDDDDLELYAVSNPGAGFLYRSGGFFSSRAYRQGIELNEVNEPGAQAYAFDYIAGYLLPGDDLAPSGTCSALAADGSFNVAGDTFPLLVSGEYVTVAGFPTAANNGRFKVLARTTGKLVVNATLVDESPSGVVSIRSRNLPRELENAAINEMRDRYLARQAGSSSNVTSERIGDWGATFATPAQQAEAAAYGLSIRTALALWSWVRIE